MILYRNLLVSHDTKEDIAKFYPGIVMEGWKRC
jgi:hypothetical protein